MPRILFPNPLSFPPQGHLKQQDGPPMRHLPHVHSVIAPESEPARPLQLEKQRFTHLGLPGGSRNRKWGLIGSRRGLVGRRWSRTQRWRGGQGCPGAWQAGEGAIFLFWEVLTLVTSVGSGVEWPRLGAERPLGLFTLPQWKRGEQKEGAAKEGKTRLEGRAPAWGPGQAGQLMSSWGCGPEDNRKGW